ncbi:MAG: AmmeMemoRadiSam system protein B [archaeon]
MVDKNKISENIFTSQVSNSFYPGTEKGITKELDSFFKDANINYSGEEIKAIIVPHAGYKYSGLTAMIGYKKLYYNLLLSTKDNYKIIVIAPAHKVYFKEISTLSSSYYQIPTGNLKIERSSLDKYNNNSAFIGEHAIEVQLPFIQYIFSKASKNFSIIPVLVGDANISNSIKAIEKEIDENTIIIVSSDLSHFLTDTKARETDKASINNILTGKKEIDACGVKGIIILNEISKERKWKSELLNYSNSGDVTRDKKSVVGYSSFSYYYPQTENILIKLARKSISDKLSNLKTNKEEIKEIIPQEYLEKKGVFVTLTINNRLRGCIGNIIGTSPVYEGVIDNAKNAAFSDHRFNKLTKNEFEKIDIEVSILSVPSSCSLSDIKKNDGVILQKGYNSAIYLPQVWEQLPNKDEFLGSLCEKAGLEWNCYKDEKTIFKKFNVEIIK